MTKMTFRSSRPANQFKKVSTCVCFLVFSVLLSSVLTNANAQSVLPGVLKINKPSPAPTAPGANFAPPMSSTTTSANTPSCAEWTRTAGPDESLVITGVNFSSYTGKDAGRDTRFLVYGENGVSSDAKIQRLDGDKAVITIDKNLANWSMYLIWPSNDKGYGSPIAVNQTEAWWLGPNLATRGGTSSVFGRNLARNNDVFSSFVYIKSASGAGQWATVTKVNPYKVDFTIPSDLSNGDYEVWTHNGHGGDYGWSGPLKLTINNGPQWTSTVFNVKSYGAKGDGSTDDVVAINNAIKAALKSTGSTVYFPAGNYMVSNTIYTGNNIILKGDGKDNTIIKCTPNFSSASWGLIYANNVSNFGINDMAFSGNYNYRGNITLPMYLRGANNVSLNRLRFSFQDYDIIDLHLTSYIFMNYCEVIGKTTFLGNGSQVFIDHCDFYLTNDSELGLHTWGGAGVSMTNSTCKDYDNSDVNNGRGWGQGRFFVGNGVWGSNRMTYLGNNTTTDLTIRPAVADQNSGEQFMWEGNFTMWSGSPGSSTSTTTTLNGFSSPDNLSRYAAIVKGRGLGQSRRITGYNGTTITLDEPWNVIPDATSIINVGNYLDRVVAYGNYMDGKPRAALSTDHTASAGIEPFGGAFNIIGNNNTFHELREGIANWGWTDTRAKGTDANYFNLYTNNKFLQCRWPIYNSDGGNTTDPTKLIGTGVLGTVYRNNVITDAVVSGINNIVSPVDHTRLEELIFEHNSFTNIPMGVASNTVGVENQIFYKNNFDKGSATASGAAITITPKIVLRENIVSGFTTKYTNTSTNIMEAPLHVVEISGSPGGAVIKSTVTLWNSGTTAATWTASSNSAWLTLANTSGNISSENDSNVISINADPKNLTAGNYTANITVSSSGQDKVYTVIFKIGNTGNPIPVSNAGPDMVITLPTSNVVLQGSGTDANGTVTAYKWSQVSGPNNSSFSSSTIASPNVSGLVQGSYVFSLVVTDNNNATSTDDQITVTVNSTASGSTGTSTPLYRINTGGNQITTSMGVFDTDGYYSTTNSYAYATTSTIAGTSDQQLYQSERFNNNGSLNYAFPVPNGQYTVVLHFAEIYFTTVGARVFDVFLEGNRVLDNYDIVKKAGPMTATKETLTVNVSDGTLNILLSSLASDGGVNLPKISAIEILKPATATLVPTYRINAGGNQLATSIGTFATDGYYSTTNSYAYSTTSTIAGTPDQQLYQSERFNNNSALNYAFPVSNGQYTVVLHFAEIYFTTVGARVFDIFLEGNRVMDNYDIVKKAGPMTATKETFVVNVTDGTLNILLSSLASDGGVNLPKISAIEILSGNGAQVSSSFTSTEKAVAKVEKQQTGKNSHGLSVKVLPNPSKNHFTLTITSNSQNASSIKIFGLDGRLVETRKNIEPNKAFQIGESYKPGVYYAEIVQDNDKAAIQIIKVL